MITGGTTRHTKLARSKQLLKDTLFLVNRSRNESQADFFFLSEDEEEEAFLLSLCSRFWVVEAATVSSRPAPLLDSRHITCPTQSDPSILKNHEI